MDTYNVRIHTLDGAELLANVPDMNAAFDVAENHAGHKLVWNTTDTEHMAAKIGNGDFYSIKIAWGY